MKLNRFFIFLFIITAISLLYVQMQVEIVKLAYEGKAKENRFKDLLDTKSILMYNIHKSESVHNLGEKILCKQTDLKFADRNQIALLRLPAKLSGPSKINLVTSRQPISNFFANLFSLKSQAEATEKIK